MAIDFPDSPTDGQEFQGYYWDDSKQAWRSQSTNRGSVITSATTPTGATAGDLWFNTVDGTMYVYYDDGITTQWVEIQANVDNYKTPSQNYIINGAFDIWQRGESLTISNFSFQYSADQWLVRHPGPGTTTVSRQTFTPGAAPVSDYEGRFFLRATCTADYTEILQRIEDVRTLAGKTVTLSFWAKSASNQTLSIYRWQDFGTGGSSQLFNTVGNIDTQITTSWQRVSKTFTIPSVSGKTIGENSWLGVEILGQQNIALDIWGVQLEEGSVATPFRRNQPNIQAELAACQRYCYVKNGSTSDAMWGWGRWEGNSFYCILQHPVQMRVPPSLPVLTSPSGLQVVDPTVAWYNVSGVSSIHKNGTYASDVLFSMSGASVANKTFGIMAVNSGNPKLVVSAEL
jgi:hypothetical protein